jgi:hypothetical protein
MLAQWPAADWLSSWENLRSIQHPHGRAAIGAVTLISKPLKHVSPKWEKMLRMQVGSLVWDTFPLELQL